MLHEAIVEVAISTTFDFNLPFNAMVPMIRQAGFSLISLSGGDYERSGYLKSYIREEMLQICRKQGIRIDSLHAPLSSMIDISSVDHGIREYSVQIMKKAIHACDELKCSLLILHLSNRFPEGDLPDRIVGARHSLEELIPYAKHKGVHIAVENLVNPASNMLFRTILSELSDTTVGVCFDTSHAHLTKDLHAIMQNYGSRIIAIHVSDNKEMLDDHLLPFEGTIDWLKFMEVFTHINYAGTFLIEAEIRESMFQDPQTFLDQAYARAHKLVSMIK